MQEFPVACKLCAGVHEAKVIVDHQPGGGLVPVKPLGMFEPELPFVLEAWRHK